MELNWRPNRSFFSPFLTRARRFTERQHSWNTLLYMRHTALLYMYLLAVGPSLVSTCSIQRRRWVADMHSSVLNGEWGLERRRSLSFTYSVQWQFVTELPKASCPQFPPWSWGFIRQRVSGVQSTWDTWKFPEKKATYRLPFLTNQLAINGLNSYNAIDQSSFVNTI